MVKLCEKCESKASALFNFGRLSKKRKVIYFEGGLSKVLKKLTLFCLVSPFPFDGQDYEKIEGACN